MSKFAPDDVVYWTNHDGTNKVIGVAIVLDGSRPDYVRFRAWRFLGYDITPGTQHCRIINATPGEWKSDEGRGDCGIAHHQVFHHPNPDSVWADYCAWKLTGE